MKVVVLGLVLEAGPGGLGASRHCEWNGHDRLAAAVSLSLPGSTAATAAASAAAAREAAA